MSKYFKCYVKQFPRRHGYGCEASFVPFTNLKKAEHWDELGEDEIQFEVVDVKALEESQQAMKFWSMRGDHSACCPNHDEVKGVEIVEPFTIHNVTVDGKYYKCPVEGCDMTWLSGRQESDIDMQIKNKLLEKIKSLEALCVEGLQANDSIEWHLKVDKEVVKKK